MVSDVDSVVFPSVTPELSSDMPVPALFVPDCVTVAVDGLVVDTLVFPPSSPQAERRIKMLTISRICVMNAILLRP
jgi:hypothetical protein